MPFKDKERNREWHRECMRRRRASLPRPFFHILERDNFRCQYCGRTPRDSIQLQVDHITPRWLGGAHTDDNLVTACAQCNAAKSGKLLRMEAEATIRQGLTVTPNIDADGNPIPDYE